MSRFSNANVLIHPDGATAQTVLAQSLSVNPNENVSSPDSGYTYSKFNRILEATPDIMFTTEDILQVLTAVSLNGLCITSSSNPGLVATVLKHDPCLAAGRATSNHTSFTMTNGHLLIDSISASSPGAASCALRAYGVSTDGVTYPIADAHNVATPVQPTNGSFIAGNLKLSGMMIPQLVSINVRYQVRFNNPIYAGGYLPTLFDVVRIEPVLTFVVDDVYTANLVLSYGSLGACTHANSYFQFRAMTSAGAPAGTGSSVHIRGTFDGDAVLGPAYDANGQGTGNSTIVVRCTDDATYAPLVWILSTTYSTS